MKTKLSGFRSLFLAGTILLIMNSCSIKHCQCVGGANDLKTKIVGTWQLCSTKDSLPITNYSGREGQRRYKLITPKTFVVIDFVEQSKEMYAAFMGDYSIEDGNYTEFLQYTGSGYRKYLAEKNTFSIRIENDFMFIKDIDNKYSPEIWKRIK